MPKDLGPFLAHLTKKLKGAATVTPMKDVKTAYGIRLPTGISGIDRALKGGFPGGSLHQVHGPDGAGKDYITNRLIAEQQALHGDDTNIFWMTFGYRPDVEFMRMCGVQIAFTDEELIARGIDPKKATVEQRGKDVGQILFFDIHPKKAANKPAETTMQSVIECVESNLFQMGVVNEMASGETKYDVAEMLGSKDVKIANWAKLVSDWCRKFYGAIRVNEKDGSPNKTTIFVINPVRANLDSRTSKYQKHIQTSGTALKHAKACDLHLDTGAQIKVDDVKVGKLIRWKLSKGKHGVGEGGNGAFEFYFAGGVDLVRELAREAKAEEIITAAGPVYRIAGYVDPDTKKPISIKGGLSGVVTLLREDDVLRESVTRALLEKARGW